MLLLRRFSSTLAAPAVRRDGPLKGVKVVDLTRVLAGPLATMMLADLGADVIKIESPQGGDDTRSWAPPNAPLKTDGPRAELPPESAYFLQANRNKRSVTVNLKHEHGREIVRELVKDADVFVENYVPGKLNKFGLDYESLKALNPGLIYCSITGYGPTGPYAQSPGYAVVLEAEAGLMSITGDKAGGPVKVGVAVTDVLAGHFAHSSVLAALYRRKETGQGAKVDCSLFESQIASLVNIGSNWLIGGVEGRRLGTEHPSIVPYQVLPTADGHLMLAAGNDNQFRILCSSAVLNREHWAIDDRYATNSQRVKHREILIAELERVLADRTTAEWVKLLTGKGIPFAPINNIQQTFEHPQAIAREVVEHVEHPRAGNIKLAASAFTIDGKKPKAYRAPPYLGQHTLEVLRELGYSPAKIADLEKSGAV